MIRWIRHSLELVRCVLRLRPRLRGGRWLLVGTLSAALFGAFLEMAGIALLTQVIVLLQRPVSPGGAVPPGMARSGTVPHGKLDLWAQLEKWLPEESAAFYVAVFCAAVVGVMLLKNLALLTSTLLGVKLRVRMSLNLREELFRRLQRAELSFFENRKSGEIAGMFYHETNRVAVSVEYFVLLTQRLCLVIFWLVWLIFLSWQLTLMGMGLAMVIGIAVGGFQRKLKRAGAGLGAAHQTFGGRLTEAFGGLRIVRALNAQAVEEERFRQASSALSNVEAYAARTSALIPPVAETLGVTGAMLIVAVAYSRLIQGGKLEPAFLFAFGVVITRLLPMLNQMASLSGSLFVMGEGFREVERWLATPQFPRRPFGNRQFQGVQTEVRFDDIGFVYPNGKVALEGINLVVPSGKTMALVGESGSGKSTLATLLLRLREPTQGRILVDGIDYWEFSPASWHERTSVVEQEAFLFNDSVSGNILYGRAGIDGKQLGRAIKTAHLEDVVRALPQGLDTPVGERGALLSGGQRQRLAIARAVVSDPQLLILDEATSALDSVSERMVQTALEEARHGRTVLVIAHRLSTIRKADQIVVLHGGRVVEQGTWAELVAQQGYFSRLTRSDEFIVGTGTTVGSAASSGPAAEVSRTVPTG